MKIIFEGADQNVTGSKHLIQSNGYNLLLDCGFYQGRRAESNELNRNLPFSAKDIDAVILSHAHLDHCGTLPILVKQGFKGKIYCTPATAEIAEYILFDSAEIQKQDAIYFNSHIEPGEEEIFPIYDKQDVLEALKHFETVEYFKFSQQWTHLNNNIRFKLYDAGHILGSAVILVEVKENDPSTNSTQIKTIAFTGDLGRNISPILPPPECIEENVDSLIAECTYGDKIHQPISDAKGNFRGAISTVLKNKGKIIVPAFSLGRTQDIIYTLQKLTEQKLIPSIPIYIDSPLSKNITEIFPKYIKYFNDKFQKNFKIRGGSPFSLKNLTYIQTINESKSLNNKSGPIMIISASGMCEGGRVLHHLKNNINNPQNIILLTGYQAEHTLGRKLQEGISPVKIYGRDYNVKAQVKTLHEFSAHADQTNLLSYVLNTKNLQKLFLVHTELPQATTFKELLQKSLPTLPIEIPTMGQSFEV